MKNELKRIEEELSMAEKNMNKSLVKISGLKSKIYWGRDMQNINENKFRLTFKIYVRRLQEEIEFYETSLKTYEHYKEIKTELENN